MDEYADLYNDSDIAEDTAADESGGDMEDSSVDNGGTFGIEDVLRDVLNDYFSTDEDAPKDGEETESDAVGDSAELDEESADYTEILVEIRDTLRQHTDEVSGFMSEVTVSGNAVMVSLDGNSTSLLEENIAGQELILEGMDYISGLMVMTLFVLVFDILHRFAKRIIKNVTRGDDEKNAADS
ncbi:MAG: hypothetical protein J1F42_01995 [Lachnospiraceae bacterium]|nr:hypothetical protein [Lachnospiraceae bacterium]